MSEDTKNDSNTQGDREELDSLNEKKNIEIEYLTSKGKGSKNPDTENKKLKGKIKKLNKDIDELKKKIKEQNEEYMRQMADKDNLRKRLEREKTDYYQYALADLLKGFLDILDNFERALTSKDELPNDASFSEGIDMIYKQFKDLIFKQGVTPIDIEDKHFDPHVHQAFLTEESEDVEEPMISEELQKGYRIHDRLLRPSFVKVTVPKKES